MSLIDLFWVVLLTLTPTLELRASIPYAMLALEWSPWLAGPVCILINTLIALPVWAVMGPMMKLAKQLPVIGPFYLRYEEKRRTSLQRLVDRWGVLGLAFFIGVPLPGTGVWSGCVAASLLEFRFRDYLLGSFLGCVIAGTAVTLIVASGSEAFSFMLKHS